jgi:spore coat protein U-like protein
MKKILKALAAMSFGLLAVGAVQAQTTATTTFQVTATVDAACSVTAQDLVFGSYLATANKDSTSTISVTCTSGTGYAVDVGATPTVRIMTGPGGDLTYGMFSDSTHTSAFSITGASGNGLAQSHTVYGRIPSGQYLAAGDYAGTVNVTVTY